MGACAMGLLRLVPSSCCSWGAAVLAQAPTYGDRTHAEPQKKSAPWISPSVQREWNCLRGAEAPRRARSSTSRKRAPSAMAQRAWVARRPR